MGCSELDNFYVKFKDLWQRGLDVHLSVKGHAGQAWVTLHAGLGHPQQPPPQQHHCPRNGPAQRRRRERRAAARRAPEENSAEDAANFPPPPPQHVHAVSHPANPLYPHLRVEEAVEADPPPPLHGLLVQHAEQAAQAALQPSVLQNLPEAVQAPQGPEPADPLPLAHTAAALAPAPSCGQVSDELCHDTEFYQFLEHQRRLKEEQIKQLSRKTNFGFKPKIAKPPF